MSLLAALAIVSACSWDNPGANPYRGPVPASVQRYTDIPKDVRDKLQTRMEKRQFDEVVTIERDRIHGSHEYTDLRSMHFGNGRICETVSRTKWKATATERGLVYCEKEHCIIVPTVCNNVSRVTRVPKREEPPKAGGTPPAAVPPAATVPPVQDVPSGGTLMAAPGPVPYVPRTFEDGSRPWAPPVFFPPPPAPFPPGFPPIFPPVLPPANQIPGIPEPSTYALLLAGLSVLLIKRRKK